MMSAKEVSKLDYSRTKHMEVLVRVLEDKYVSGVPTIPHDN